MKRLLSCAVALVAVVAVLAAAPARADQVGLDDPAGDRETKRGLDITGATLRNLGDRIVVVVDFRSSVRGDLIVSVDPRRARGIRLVSEYRPVEHTRSYVLQGSFSDGAPGGARVQCRGFRVRWSADEPTVRLVLPARCLRHGDYDELRFAVLTERGEDTDWAPEDTGASPWVARG